MLKDQMTSAGIPLWGWDDSVRLTFDAYHDPAGALQALTTEGGNGGFDRKGDTAR
jgi:hypothetical protein